MAQEGMKYGRMTLLRKKAPRGLMRLSSMATRNASTHTNGVHTAEKNMVFFRPRRNMGFCQTAR